MMQNFKIYKINYRNLINNIILNSSIRNNCNSNNLYRLFSTSTSTNTGTEIIKNNGKLKQHHPKQTNTKPIKSNQPSENEESGSDQIVQKKKYNNQHIMIRAPEDRSLSQKQYFEKLAERGDIEKMEDLLKLMPQKRTLYAYEKLILACSKRGNFNLSYKFYNQMKKDQVKPSVYVFGTLLNTCTTATGIDSKIIEERINKIFEDIAKYEVEVSVNIFNILMKSLIQLGKNQEAISFIDRLKSIGVKPDITTFTTWVIAQSEKIKAEYQLDIKGKDILEEIRTSKNSQRLDEIRSEGNKQIDHFLNIIKEAKKNQVSPDRYFINTILNACKHTLNPEGVFYVWKILQENKYTQHLNADTRTYDILVSTCNNINDIDKAIELTTEIFNRSIRPDIHLVNNLYRVCLRIASMNSIKKRDQYDVDKLIDNIINYMASYNLFPNEESFSILISTYSKLGKHNKVYELLTEMKELGIKPTVKHYSGIITSFSSDVGKCLEIFKVIVSQNIIATPDFIINMQKIMKRGNDSQIEAFRDLIITHDQYSHFKKDKKGKENK
ncbi:hypothetical protein DICPUDRAFT_152635 [Dictyostelium purpureum]|uniref:PROP1-like PPR domain-containing protein n=1 Tax=Dictyostelium purpureum TaxID=5786 RepID=F0ZLW7_DICPU|nr:uncharacterized protein DICPUDRAFT_152635 [Dictyostelium purpureum]EGC35059.1 hypothetical protein DICPUDRAFT_152635 [Dictyostelium purpureum]|eukprot:XP_003288427.1 hypothetical protein DICPUDRAFT_152635 [Dictyostelium purpureum]